MPENSPKLPQILLIDKTKGKTSYDTIRALKRRFPGVKLGHAGTLDPNATGLLIIGVGEGTKRLTEFLKLPKTYEAEILFGMRTDTGDVTGRIIESCNTEHVTKNMVENAVAELVGIHPYILPAYSAVKQAGVPLYKKARRGEFVEPPAREMEVKKAVFNSLQKFQKEKIELFYGAMIDHIAQKTGLYQIAQITFDVGSGTYIRSLAEELGRKLGVPATLKELRRTRIDKFSVEGAEII